MLIEIYTDASHHNQSKTGFWAFIILINNNEVARHSGSLKGHSINEIELAATQKSLEWLNDYPYLNEIKEINLYTDSLGVIGKINKFKKKEKIYHENWKPLEHFVNKVNWKHVPAHSGHYYNEICDKIVRNAHKSKTKNLNNVLSSPLFIHTMR